MADTTGAPSAAPITITMKLLVDTRPPRPRVVFAEAGKDAVDFLFSLLTLPAGTAVRLLGKESMAGSVGNLYSSVERLEGSYLRPGFGKDALLCHAVEASPSSACRRRRTSTGTFFTCGGGTTSHFSYQGCRGYVSDARAPGARPAGTDGDSPSTWRRQRQHNRSRAPPRGRQASRGSAPSPPSGASPRSGEDRAARVQGGLEILKVSLRSKTVLTDVFLGTGGKKPPSSSSKNGGTRYECLTWRVDDGDRGGGASQPVKISRSRTRGGDQQPPQGALRGAVPAQHPPHRRQRARGDLAHGLQHRGRGAVPGGQSIRVIADGETRTGSPWLRLYSIASSALGDFGDSDRVALRQAPRLTNDAGELVKGVCSNFLCDLKPGSEVKITGPVGKEMLMPKDPNATHHHGVEKMGGDRRENFGWTSRDQLQA
ncbi:hypothetical protein ZWY2020_015288 [Hordeum vulgare]|nr:hypothetical protein ZWY2020_015288 [Hordeum vulgare]